MDLINGYSDDDSEGGQNMQEIQYLDLSPISNEGILINKEDSCELLKQTKSEPIDSVNRDKPILGVLPNDSKEDDKACNYFNLNDNSSSDSEKDFDNKSGEPPDYNVHTIRATPFRNNTEIADRFLKSGDSSYENHPDSSFWRGENSSVQEALRPAIVNPWTISSCSTTTESYKSTSQINLRKKIKRLDQSLVNPIELTSTGYKRKAEISALGSFESDISSKQTCQAQQKNVYFVHHKIQSHLGQKHTSYLPRHKIVDIPAHNKAIPSISWCVSQYSHLILTAGMDGIVALWNVFSSVDNFVQNYVFHQKAVKCVAWSKDGKHFSSGSFDKTVKIVDTECGKEVSCCKHEKLVNSVQYHPVNSNYIISGSDDTIICWDKRNTTRHMKSFRYNDTFGLVQDIAFLQDGNTFFTCNDLVSKDSSDRNIMAWDFNSGVVLSNQIYQERYTCTSLRVHPHEREFIANTQGNYIAKFSTIRPYKIDKCRRYEGHKVLGYKIGVDFSPDGRHILSGSADGQAVVYDYNKTRPVNTLSTGQNSVCLDVAWHPVLPGTIACSTWDGRLVVWS